MKLLRIVCFFCCFQCVSAPSTRGKSFNMKHICLLCFVECHWHQRRWLKLFRIQLKKWFYLFCFINKYMFFVCTGRWKWKPSVWFKWMARKRVYRNQNYWPSIIIVQPQRTVTITMILHLTTLTGHLKAFAITWMAIINILLRKRKCTKIWALTW